MPRIAVVIYNQNGREQLKQFLPSVVAHSEGADIYVIDNASTDDSVSFVTGSYPTIKTIAFPEVLSFGAVYNKALTQIDSAYYVILNANVEVTPNWLTGPINQLEENTNIAACQPKIKSFDHKDQFSNMGAAGGFADKHGIAFSRGSIYDTVENDNNQYDTPTPLLWGSTLALIVRATDFKLAQGFDESFNGHLEDLDLGWHLNNLGKELWYSPSSVVYHQSIPTTFSTSDTFQQFKNGIATLYKNQYFHFIPTLFTRLVIDGLYGVRLALQGKPNHTWAIARAHFSFYAELGQYKTKRRQISHVKKPLKVIYSESIYTQYFLKGIRYFSNLKFDL